MKRFFNNPDAIVSQAMDGALRVSNHRLVRANGYPHTKFVVRKDWDRSKVAVISGGGAGHEPTHVGFVGEGMLTAAISGEVFASPTVEAILTCILEVTGEAGCLLVVKNYTGDRLNFGLAAERAKKLGKKVEMVVVSDDIALPGAPQPRGIAGTLFVHKCVGYLAERGESLEAIKFIAEEVANDIISLGLALSTCTLPGAEPAYPIEDPELGLGIHGESGAEKIDFANGKEAVDMVLDHLRSAADPEGEYAVIINNLGSVTYLEMCIITDEVLTSDLGDRIKYVIGPGSLCTSLNMYGFSVSLFKLNPEYEQYLLAPVEPKAWIPAVEPMEPEILDIGHIEIRHNFQPSDNENTRKIVLQACNALIDSETDLNLLDAKVGDGEAGFTFADGARAVKNALLANELPLNQLDALASAVGQILASAMGGSSGVLNSIMFTRAGAALSEGSDWADAFYSGVEMLMAYGGAMPGDRTMVDALIPAVEKLQAGDIHGAAVAAREGAQATSEMTEARAGRSSYLRAECLEGVTDPGAEAVARVFEAVEKLFA